MMSCDRRMIKSTKTNSFGSTKEEESDNKQSMDLKFWKFRSASFSPEKKKDEEIQQEDFIFEQTENNDDPTQQIQISSKFIPSNSKNLTYDKNVISKLYTYKIK